MNKKLIWVVLSLLVVVSMLSMLVVSCGEEEVTTTPPPTTTPPTTTPAEEPQYGGTLVYRAGFIDVIANPLDPRSTQFGPWIEALFMDDMTVDRSEFGFGCNFFPLEYRAGQLAESWEWKEGDPLTIIVHLRQGVHWQDKAPTHGREFTSDDVAYTYSKVLGTGEFAGQNPDPFLSALLPSIAEVVATETYTVEFHFKSVNPFTAYEVVNPWMSIPIAPREYYALTAEQQADWHNVPGIGAFMLTDFVSGTSMTAIANPTYYGVDERYDDNPLPYLDAVKILVIPDMATALSALRTGEIDMLVDARTYPTLADTLALAETNPDIQHFQQAVMAPGIFFHWDQATGTIDAPFDDIRVRKAMQLAVDNALIAETFYQGTVDGIPGGLLSPLAGDWNVPFAEWPAELQAEYSYNLDEAKALMAEAGHADGFDATILTNPDDYPEVLEIVKAQLLEIGIDMTINSVGMMEQRPLVQAGNFETLWAAITGTTNSSPSDAVQSFYSKKFERIGQGGGAVDAAYDAIVERYKAATTEADCKAIFQEADRYWLEQHWAVITFTSWSHQFAQAWVKGYVGERFWSTNTWSYIARVWIDKT